MKNQVTFGHIMAILSIIILPSLGWGIRVEKGLDQGDTNSLDIIELKKERKEDSKQNQMNHAEVMDKLHLIELGLKDKKDRE